MYLFLHELCKLFNITVLPKGLLQYFLFNGNVSQGAITVNIGDQLMWWSDDRLKSTFHRVRVPGPEEYQVRKENKKLSKSSQ